MVYSKPTKAYPNYIRYYCKQQGYTLQDLAEKIGLPRRTLTDYVTGVRPVPRTWLTKIARTLGCSIKELIPSPGLEPITEENTNDVLIPTKQEISSLQVSSKKRRQQKSPQSLQAIPVPEIVPVSSPASPIILSHLSTAPLHLTPSEVPSHNQMGTWLALETCQIGQLYELGWSTENILSTLKVLLQSVEGMPKITRCKLLELSGAAMVSSITLPMDERISEEERAQLCGALGKSIGESWKLFNSINTPQFLIIGQTHLYMLQQVHSLILPDARPYLYSPVYRMIGAALFFSARYKEALHAHEQAYLTALEAGDSWNMAESLSWQAGVWKACGQHEKSIQLTQSALRLLSEQDSMHSRSAQARFLAHWAESEALLQRANIADEKLQASAELLSQLELNMEFDTSTWYYYKGACAFYLHKMEQANVYFELAGQGHHTSWTLQRANTVLMQVEAYLHMKDWQSSFVKAKHVYPLIITLDSPLLSYAFRGYVQELCKQAPEDKKIVSFAEDVQKQLHLLAHPPIPRYLEAAIS